MKPKGLLNFTEAAAELDTDYKVIAGLVKAHGIEPKATGLPGKAKGLDSDDMRILRKALGRPARAKATA